MSEGGAVARVLGARHTGGGVDDGDVEVLAIGLVGALPQVTPNGKSSNSERQESTTAGYGDSAAWELTLNPASNQHLIRQLPPSLRAGLTGVC
jgi:hypothetical protein